MGTRTSGISFPLPPVLRGTITPAAYDNWVRVKSWALFKRDRKRKLPPALNCPVALYKAEVNSAVAASGPLDPYTGDKLAWGLIGTWDPQQAKIDPDYARRFHLMPTVDHIDPEEKARRLKSAPGSSTVARAAPRRRNSSAFAPG